MANERKSLTESFRQQQIPFARPVRKQGEVLFTCEKLGAYAQQSSGAARAEQETDGVPTQNPQSELQKQSSTATLLQKHETWVTVVHNDPVNLMLYVQWIFQTYFKMDANIARLKMMQVHREGRAVVATGGREQMERDAQAMHTYGLWATIEPAGEAQ